ncbi:DUF2235 domain-containing protein [Massilia forsythiae]|uniref:DUF2235 domain-containing protein n=1 Tax=Massilia forsythiae TaxID=2728020 RepID=A0A7Z2W0Q0_9BURK|nr:DUF2235 domain-containing protein [Massilia forsythiae]QJE02628.1 DUF2235 domain-containing protein [Massilia forsythiae]
MDATGHIGSVHVPASRTPQQVSVPAGADEGRPPPHGREAILEACIAADAGWRAQPGRNLVLLFDGTGNILGNHQDTNVVKLLRLLQKEQVDVEHARRQVVYYDPGVGTSNQFPVGDSGAWIASKLRLLSGLAMGSGVFDNIADAYIFLMRNYREGDRIFLFGFSRGAFTARAVGGMLNMYGLVSESCLSLMPSMVTTYFARRHAVNRAGRDREGFAFDIERNFSSGRQPLVHFTGVWDSVETIGSGFMGGIRITNRGDLEDKRFVHVRQALSIHESRAKYAPRAYIPPRFTAAEAQYRSFGQQWFRGVHSDVGGSYQRDGLSLIALKWMVDEAIGCGLLVQSPDVEPGNPQTPMHDQTYDSPYWAWTGIDARPRGRDDMIHPSALPIAAAVPAEAVPPARQSRQIGWCLTALTAASAAGAWLAYGAAGSPVASTVASVLLPAAHAAAPATAPWPADGPGLHVALALEWLYLLFFTLWLAYPMAFALRRLVRPAIASGTGLGPLARHAKYLMGATVLSGAYKIVVTHHLATAPTQLAAAAVANLACYLLVLAVVAQGLLARPGPMRRD